jgi:hypothetical protein
VTTDDIYDDLQRRLRQVARRTDAEIEAFRKIREADDRDYMEWQVTVPPYDHDGVVIERFEVSREEAVTSMFRASFNPQRGDRSVLAGTYTKLTVDGQLWMSDTPAEIRDHDVIDERMADFPESMLIVGLGLGMVLHRAITAYQIPRIDVIERDPRVVTAVESHYQALALEHEVDLTIWTGDVHDFKMPRAAYWDLGFFDIWAHIDLDDLPEVARLRNRFRSRLGRFEAWAQKERIAQKRRIASGKWAY